MWFTILTSFSNSSVWVWTFCQIFLVLFSILKYCTDFVYCWPGWSYVSRPAFDCGTDTLPDTQQIRTPSLMCRLRMHTPAKAEKSLHIHMCRAQEEIEIQVKVFETVTTKVEMFPFLSVEHSASRNWIQMWIQRSSRRWLPILPVSFSCIFLLLDKMLDTECPILLPVATVNTSNLKV